MQNFNQNQLYFKALCTNGDVSIMRINAVLNLIRSTTNRQNMCVYDDKNNDALKLILNAWDCTPTVLYIHNLTYSGCWNIDQMVWSDDSRLWNSTK